LLLLNLLDSLAWRCTWDAKTFCQRLLHHRHRASNIGIRLLVTRQRFLLR